MAAFDRYIQQAEQRMDGRKSFLWTGESDARARRVRQGAMLVEPATGTAETPVAFGLVHDWVGAVFIPGTTLEQTLAVGQDYNRHKDIYRPEVMDSRILAHTGNDFRVYLRLLKKKVITVVLDTEHEVHYERVDATRWRSRSRSTKIAGGEGRRQAQRARVAAGNRRRVPVEAVLLLALRGARRRDVGRMRGHLTHARYSHGAGLAHRADHKESGKG